MTYKEKLDEIRKILKRYHDEEKFLNGGIGWSSDTIKTYYRSKTELLERVVNRIKAVVR